MKEEIYKVLRIEEEDYGCEERLEGQPLLVRVTLEKEGGEVFWVKQKDDLLYERNINEGDFVCFDQDGNTLYKIEKL